MSKSVIGAAISVALLASAACGSGGTSASLSPAAPSMSAFSAQTFSASVKSASGAPSTALSHDRGDDHEIPPAGSAGTTGPSNAEAHHGELEGRILSIDATAQTFVVRSTTVSVPATAVIRHGQTMLTFADLEVGDLVHVKGATSDTAFVASDVIVQDRTHDGTNRTRLSGPIAGLAGACPALTFTVGGTTVVTSAATRFRGVACGDLANGTAVRVRGTTQTDGSVAAGRVSTDQDGPLGDHDAD